MPFPLIAMAARGIFRGLRKKRQLQNVDPELLATQREARGDESSNDPNCMCRHLDGEDVSPKGDIKSNWYYTGGGF